MKIVTFFSRIGVAGVVLKCSCLFAHFCLWQRGNYKETVLTVYKNLIIIFAKKKRSP